MDNQHDELYRTLRQIGISQAQIQRIIFQQIKRDKQKMQNKKDQPVVKSLPKIQSKLVIHEPIKIQKSVINQQNQLPPEFYDQAVLRQQTKQYQRLQQSKLMMPEPMKTQKNVKNQQNKLPPQFQDQAFFKLQIEGYERLQLYNKNKNKIKEIQQKPKPIQKKQEIIYQPSHQLPAQYYQEQILKFQQQILQKFKLNRVKSESQANYGRSQNILKNKKKLSYDFELQQQQQYQQQQQQYQQQQIDENQYVSYDYQPEQQEQQQMHQQQKTQTIQHQYPNIFLQPNILNLMINSNNQKRRPKFKQKDRDIMKLLTGPKVIITNFYANFRDKLYQIPFRPSPTVLSTKPGYEGFIQLITLQQKCQIKLQQIDKIIYSKQLNQIYIYYDHPIKIYKKSQQSFWDRVETYFAFDLFKDQIILKSLIHKQFIIKLKADKIDEVANQIKKVCNKIKEVNKIQENFNHIRQLFNKYSIQKFMKMFQKYTYKNPIRCQQIQYSLISLLYINHQIDMESIFQFGRYLNENYTPYTQQIFWRIITSLHPSSLYGDLRNYKSLSGILKATIQSQQINKVKKISQKLIKCPSFKITPSGMIPSGWSIDNRNRLVRHYKDYDYQFMKIQISDDDEQKSNLFQCRTLLKPLFEKLLSEIRFLKNTYIPLGWTQSQLKSASMWYTLNSSVLPIINRQQLLYFLGDFTKFQSNPALKAARVGQNLSSIAVTVDVDGVKTETIPDLKSPSGLLYTDGIGSISMDVTLKIQKKLTTKATAFQIRYRGCKGMLVLNRNLPDNTILVRKSMQKFLCPNKQSWKYLDIIAKNSYGAGYINHQIIILLSTNNIPNNVFFELQHQFIQNQLNNKYLYENFQGKTSFQCNKDIFQIESIGEIMNRIIKIDHQFIFKQPTLRAVLTEKHFHMFQRLIKKGHIRVQKSARLLGIIDEYNILEQGQVYCCIAKNQDQKYNVVGRCMLTKNPCMHPADIRVVKCLSRQQAAKRFKNKLNTQNYFDQLPNLVIFPQKGRIPITAQISGSDLDGDQFYISWDQRLVPKQQLQPYLIDQVKTKQRIWNGTGYDQVIKFFCQFIFNNQLGRMANCHLVWADKQGARCQQCLDLCKQYGKALDYAKKGYEFNFDRKYWVTQYPHFLQKPQKQTYTSTSILGKLYDESIKKYKIFKNNMKEMQYQVYSFKGFISQNYSDEQIRSAFRVIISFQKDFNYMVKHNRFQRQSQIYCLKLNENQKKSKYQIAERKILQTKYFHKFFFGLKNIVDPTEYYTAIRQNKSPIKYNEVQKKLILWYQISNYPIQKKVTNPDNKLRNWIVRIEKLCQIYRDSITAIGLLWFCVPSLMFQLFRQESQKL